MLPSLAHLRPSAPIGRQAPHEMPTRAEWRYIREEWGRGAWDAAPNDVRDDMVFTARDVIAQVREEERQARLEELGQVDIALQTYEKGGPNSLFDSIDAQPRIASGLVTGVRRFLMDEVNLPDLDEILMTAYTLPNGTWVVSVALPIDLVALGMEQPNDPQPRDMMEDELLRVPLERWQHWAGDDVRVVRVEKVSPFEL